MDKTDKHRFEMLLVAPKPPGDGTNDLESNEYYFLTSEDIAKHRPISPDDDRVKAWKDFLEGGVDMAHRPSGDAQCFGTYLVNLPVFCPKRGPTE